MNEGCALETEESSSSSGCGKVGSALLSTFPQPARDFWGGHFGDVSGKELSFL